MPGKESRAKPGGKARSRRTAADLMTASPRTCSPFSTVTEAALIFRDADCGVVPIVEEGKAVGILTDRDVALAAGRYADLPGRAVSDIMTKDVVTVATDASLTEVEKAFGENKVRRLLVSAPDGQLAGIISWSDLVPNLPEGDVGQVVADVIDRPLLDDDAVKRGKPISGPGSWYRPKALWGLLRETAQEWAEDRVPRLGAALAFYSVLSIAPLLIIAIAIAAMVFGQEAARGHLVEQIRGVVGKEGGEAIQSMIAHARKPGAGAVATVLGVLTLLAGAMGVVSALQDAMNTIWEVTPKPGRGVLGIIKDRFLSLGMVLGFGFLLLVSLVLSTALGAVGSLLGGLLPGAVAEVANFLVSMLVVTLLFAMIYKILPDVEISWSDVWVGSIMTALLFTIGKSLIGLYLGHSGLGSTYGAAGSLVVLLVWVYYSSQILFFGAEFTKTYADQFGTRIVPAADAVPVTEEARAQQGMPRTEAVAAQSQHGSPSRS